MCGLDNCIEETEGCSQLFCVVQGHKGTSAALSRWRLMLQLAYDLFAIADLQNSLSDMTLW